MTSPIRCHLVWKSLIKFSEDELLAVLHAPNFMPIDDDDDSASRSACRPASNPSDPNNQRRRDDT